MESLATGTEEDKVWNSCFKVVILLRKLCLKKEDLKLIEKNLIQCQILNCNQ